MEFFIMYFEMKILVICNNHAFDVEMNGNVKCVDIENINSEHMHMK
jgi:hypothetical protein